MFVFSFGWEEYCSLCLKSEVFAFKFLIVTLSFMWNLMQNDIYKLHQLAVWDILYQSVETIYWSVLEMT